MTLQFRCYEIGNHGTDVLVHSFRANVASVILWYEESTNGIYEALCDCLFFE